MRRRQFELTSLEEDFKVLGLVDQISESEAEEAGEDEETSVEEAQKRTKRARAMMRGPHRAGFARKKKAGGGFEFIKVTAAMKRKAKKYRKSTKGKKSLKKWTRVRRAKGFESTEYNRDSLMSQLSELAGLVESVDTQANKYEDYVECLENAMQLIQLLGENFFGVEGMDEIVERLSFLGGMAENGHDQLTEMDELSEDLTEELDKGIEMMVEELREAMDLWTEVKDNLEEEEAEEDGEEMEEEEDAEGDDYPEFFLAAAQE